MASKCPRVFLASSSPQRRRLLQAMGIDCEVISPEVDETPQQFESPYDYVIRLAVQKSNAVAQTCVNSDHDSVWVAADTCVVIRKRKLGKPVSEADARNMLQLLSGQVHQVYSAVAAMHNRIIRCAATVSDVEFRQLSGDEIAAYLASGESKNRAGSYAIQGRAGAFVKQLNGSLSCVIGLPVQETAQLLRLTGVAVPNDRVLAESVCREFSLDQNWLDKSLI